MDGDKINQAINALIKFIEALDSESFFNVYSFGSKYTILSSSPLKANETNKASAIKTISTFGADMGGTEVYECLKSAFANKSTSETNECERIFIFLTDGQVSNTGAIMNLIHSANSSEQIENKVRIFSVALGSDADRELVQQMTNFTFGDCKFVSDSKNLTNTITDILKTVDKQYYTHVKFGSINTVNEFTNPNTGTNFNQIIYTSVYPGKMYSFVGKNLTDCMLRAYNRYTKLDISL